MSMLVKFEVRKWRKRSHSRQVFSIPVSRLFRTATMAGEGRRGRRKGVDCFGRRKTVDCFWVEREGLLCAAGSSGENSGQAIATLPKTEADTGY